MITVLDIETTFTKEGDPSPFNPDNRLVSVGINYEYYFFYHSDLFEKSIAIDNKKSVSVNIDKDELTLSQLDSLSMQIDLNAESIINGISADSRIGHYYNNPSFGYGGYCLPKDSKQLLSSFKQTNTPQSLMEATVKSNEKRKKFIAEMIVKERPNKVGIYRLLMKANSDNTRSAAIFDIISIINEIGIQIIIYEPSITDANWSSFKVEKNLDRFKKQSDLILANRVDDSLKDIQKKVFTRDIFNIN